MIQGSPLKGMIYHNQQSNSNLQNSNSPVKISIVNFHNQFNIHNNFIINGQTGNSSSGLGLHNNAEFSIIPGANNTYFGNGAGKQSFSYMQQNPVAASTNGI